MKLFRHLVRSINDHEHYHTENNSLDFTAVPKQCLCTLNLLKTSLPILYTSWLDKYNPANPTQNVRYCCDLLTVITEPIHKCPYTATYAIGQSTAHHPLQSFCRILANPVMQKVHFKVIKVLSRMIQILTEDTASTLDVAVSDIVTILMNELENNTNMKLILAN